MLIASNSFLVENFPINIFLFFKNSIEKMVGFKANSFDMIYLVFFLTLSMFYINKNSIFLYFQF